MNIIIPKYYDPKEKLTYKADSCVPLRQAWQNNELELNALARGTYPGQKLKNDELEGLKCIGYWDIKKFQNWGLEWHTNEGIEICFLENGNLDFLLKDKLINIQTNDITITRPWIIHKLGNPNVNPSKLYYLILDVNVRHPHQQWEWPDWIILNQKDMNELTLKLRQSEQPVLKATREFRNCFIEIGRVIKHENNGKYDSRIKVLINNLFILLLDILNEGNIILDQSLVESKRTVELFLHSLQSSLDEFWTVVKMAEYCHLGVTRFTHYCKEITNCSPMEYLNWLRMRKAAKLLKEDHDAHVIDIAYMCGFSSSQYFNYAFKKHFKMSPNSYRKEKLPSYNQ
jgi:AraC-like DNA-binding protein